MPSLIPESDKTPTKDEMKLWMDRCHELMNENIMAVVCDMAVAEFITLAVKQLPRCIVRIRDLENFLDRLARQKTLSDDKRIPYEQFITEAELLLNPPSEESMIPEMPMPPTLNNPS